LKIGVEKLTQEGFAPFGSYFNIHDVDNDMNGDFSYYPDMAAMSAGIGLTGFSVCGINQRAMKVEVVEMHEHTEEVEFCMGCDSVVLAGERSGNIPDSEKFKAFMVPKDTLLRFKRHVWHFVPFPLEDTRMMVLTALPPFTYTNDAVVVRLEEPIEIEH